MGISQLCGVVMEGLQWLAGGFFELIVQPVLVGIFSIALRLVSNVLSVFGYAISTFLLSLIDFIETLFNALSGLNNTSSNGIYINFGDGQQGDLLLQAITHPVVLNVFYATAVVGIFLLIMTTIFQMIKVEYTTEGAQNSKTSILGKSLKSLTNMLIIPLLVIFGIVIGNQVLRLIDVATKGNANAKISGTLWVTAASPALLLAGGDNKVVGMIMDVDVVGWNVGVLYTVGLIDSITYGITQATKAGHDAWVGENEAFTNMMDGVSLFGRKEAANRDGFTEDEKAFMNVASEHKYYSILDVCSHYNVFDVNYFVLILGACIIIKCLYHVCFGMIDRLYQCVALFIVMPMVVGMSPVKDSLASWRQKFIGKALSAYGIVISMNLFFVISRLFLSLTVKVSGPVGALGGLFLTGLIKAIFLIVGCLMIEKLSADMGSYFGAADALGEGKKLSGEVGKMAQKGIASAVMVGMAVASGGASLAAGASGLAAKLGASKAAKAGAKALTGQVADAAANKASAGSKFNTAFKKITGDNVDQRFDEYSQAASERDKQQELMEDASAKTMAAYDIRDAQDKILNDKNSTDEQRKEARDKKEAAQADIDKYSAEAFDAEHKRDDAQAKVDKIGGDQAGAFYNAYSAKKNLDSANEKYNNLSAQKAKQDADKKEAKYIKAAYRATRWEGLKEYGKNKFGIKAIGEKILGKEVMGIGKDMDAAVKAANDTDEGKQMLANIEDAKSKKKNDEYNIRHKGIIAEQQRVTTSNISTATIEKVEFNEKSNNLQLDKLAEGFNKSTTDDDRNWYLQQMRAINASITRPENNKFDISNNASYHVNFDMTEFKKTLDEAIKRRAKTSELEQIIQEQLQKWGQEGNTKLLNDMYKVLTELRSNSGK